MSGKGTGLKPCHIVGTDKPNVRVNAQYNPAQIQIDKSVPWGKHGSPKGNTPMLEFTAGENRTLSVELFFDAFETEGDVFTDYVKKLEEMTLAPDGEPQEKTHPPIVMFVWDSGFPSFLGVVTSLSTKYTMFRSNGTPVRATCSLKLTEVDPLQK